MRNQLRRLLTYCTAAERRSPIGADVSREPETITRPGIVITGEFDVRTAVIYRYLIILWSTPSTISDKQVEHIAMINTPRKVRHTKH